MSGSLRPLVRRNTRGARESTKGDDDGAASSFANDDRIAAVRRRRGCRKAGTTLW